jgi:hypothetical protein
MSHRAPLALAGCLALLLAALAAPQGRCTETAEELVREALHREIYGAAQERNALLAKAAELSPAFAPAMWHRGYVNVAGKWIEAARPLPAARQLAEYQNVRTEFADTPAGQMQLAEWCRGRRLAEQERAHLTRVIELDPQHVEARGRLGFRPVGGDWVSQAEVARAEQSAAREQQAVARWREQLDDIKRLLAHPSARRREIGAARLAAINEPDAVRPLERTFAQESPQAAALLVEALSKIGTHEAALALARQAVLSRWSEVRELAVRRLREHKPDQYVPQLLAAMHTPISGGTMALRAPSGDLVFRQTLRREGRDQREELVLDSAAGNSVERSDIARENFRTEWLNERIAAALNLATEQNLPASPEAWWQWWNEQNEVFVSGEKPLHSVRPTEQLARIEREYELELQLRAQEAALRAREAALRAASQAQSQPQTPRRSDCLAAGTPVWTIAGPVAVEKLRLGDLVLSQDVETGELAYKPVLGTTIRPSSTLVRIQCGEEVFQASGGHPFWVAGEGWVKARDLQGGMELHTVAGPLRVSAVEDGDTAESYNLIVADFSDYFIGAAGVLSHDNTLRRPTNAIVPGLQPR